MQKTLERSNERGKAKNDWLDTKYSFSFSNYFNPNRMGFGSLRVLNDDTIQAGKGFGTHSHENMEIITIVLEGTLAHKDSSGGQGTIKAGEVQVMSAGTGVSHSEYNASKTEPVSLLQIWITPKEEDIKPRYDQKAFPKSAQENSFSVIASGGKEKDSLYIHQEAKLNLGEFEKDRKVSYSAKKGNGIFIFMIKGSIAIADEELKERDSISIEGINQLTFNTLSKTHILIIEVP